MLCKDNRPTSTINPRYIIQKTKKIYDQKQKAHIMLNEQCKAMHDSA